MQYTRKYHLTTAENMSTDWLGPRIYRPSLEEVLRGRHLTGGAETSTTSRISGIRRGAASPPTCSKFLPLGELKLQHELVDARSTGPGDSRSRNGIGDRIRRAWCPPVPLPELVPMIAGAPAHVIAAAATARLFDLRAGQCRRRSSGSVRGAHVILLRRGHLLHAPELPAHAVAGTTCLQGAGSIQAEVYFSSKYRPLDRLSRQPHRTGHQRPPPLRPDSRGRTRSCSGTPCWCLMPT